MSTMTPIEENPAKGLNAAVAAELRAERAATRLTFDELATRSGISRRTVIRLLNAERAITTSYLEAIAHELNISPATVMERAIARQAGESRPLLSEVPPIINAPDEARMAANPHAHESEQGDAGDGA